MPKLIEKAFKDLDYYLKDIAVDLGKAGHKKTFQKIVFQC